MPPSMQWMHQWLDALAPVDAARPQAPVVPLPLGQSPVPTPPDLSSPWRHPQARRVLWLGDTEVSYTLQRARRRSIGFTVGPKGLAVRAPHGLPLAALDAALHAKSTWILRKLGDMQARQRQQAQARIDWQGDTVLPLLGTALRVLRDPSAPTAGLWQALPAPGPGGVRQVLRLRVAQDASAAQLRAAVQAWWMRQARAHFTARLEHFAPLLGVRWSSLRLSSARTRWGSAKSDGSIRLNWRLLHYRPDIIDYVVAHELAHLRVMDHSARFWATVATVVPEHAALRRRLRDDPAPPWD